MTILAGSTGKTPRIGADLMKIPFAAPRLDLLTTPRLGNGGDKPIALSGGSGRMCRWRPPHPGNSSNPERARPVRHICSPPPADLDPAREGEL